MKVQFKEDFGSPTFGLLKGEIREVVEKKEPNPWTHYTQYVIMVGSGFKIKVPEYYVTELTEGEESK